MQKVVSKDGTTIAYEKIGEGPPLILLGGGFRDHTAFSTLVPDLAPHLTTYTYDRRGRGESGDAPTYTIQKEVEDIEALIAEAGGEAAVFGGSSGGMLALEAAMTGSKISKLALMEPPYRLPGYEKQPPEFGETLRALLKQEKRTEACEYFLAKMAGFAPEEIEAWKAGPMWTANEAMAHTLAYDTAILEQSDVPVERLSKTQTPVLIINSDSTSEWLLEGAKAAAAALPNGRQVSLPGVWHKVPPEVLAPALIEFVTG